VALGKLSFYLCLIIGEHVAVPGAAFSVG